MSKNLGKTYTGELTINPTTNEDGSLAQYNDRTKNIIDAAGHSMFELVDSYKDINDNNKIINIGKVD